VARAKKDGMDWLQDKMAALELASLEEVAQRCGINRGNLYRYFRWETRPSIDVIPNLCEGLEASPLEILEALGIQTPVVNRAK
jgi:transcriptional regulator with XRE-family HTH domain